MKQAIHPCFPSFPSCIPPFPQEWGQPGALPSLLQLRVDSNRL